MDALSEDEAESIRENVRRRFDPEDITTLDELAEVIDDVTSWARDRGIDGDPYTMSEVVVRVFEGLDVRARLVPGAYIADFETDERKPYAWVIAEGKSFGVMESTRIFVDPTPAVYRPDGWIDAPLVTTLYDGKQTERYVPYGI